MTGSRTEPCARLGSSHRGLSGGGHDATLIRRPELDIDEEASMLFALSDDLTGDDLRVADVVELPHLVALAHDPPVVTDPVGEVVRQPASRITP